MPRIDDHLSDLAGALCRASDEHGVPNAFSPAELNAHHGGPPPLFAGLVATTMNVALDGRLRERGYRLVRYADRTLHVDRA